MQVFFENFVKFFYNQKKPAFTLTFDDFCIIQLQKIVVLNPKDGNLNPALGRISPTNAIVSLFVRKNKNFVKANHQNTRNVYIKIT